MYKNVTHRHPRHNVCAGVSGVTKEAGTGRQVCSCVLSVGVDKYFFMMMASGCMQTHCMLITFLMERGACMHPLVIIT